MCVCSAFVVFGVDEEKMKALFAKHPFQLPLEEFSNILLQHFGAT